MVRTGPWLGLLGSAGLALILRPGVIGLLLAGGYGLTLALLLRRGLARSGATAFGPANGVTLVRAVLVGGVLALVASPVRDPGVVAVLSAAVLLLDNLDGRVARGTRTVTEFGARFDLEVDAFLILLLSIAVAPQVGWWVLAIGAARYLLVIATWRLAWLRPPAPPRYWCKVVAVVQGVVLTVVLTDLLPTPIAITATAIALVLLGESFGREAWWKWQQRVISAPAGPQPLPLPTLRPRRSAAWSRTTDRHRMPCTTSVPRHLHGQGS